MNKRTNGIAAALAVSAAIAVSVPGVARAQDGVAPQPTTSDGLPPRPEDEVFITPEALAAASATLGDAWASALHAVLDSMDRYVQQERLAAEKTVVAPKAPERRPAAAWATLKVPPRTAPAHARVRLEPLPIEPVTYNNADPKGDSGTLLGVAVELPWLVP